MRLRLVCPPVLTALALTACAGPTISNSEPTPTTTALPSPAAATASPTPTTSYPATSELVIPDAPVPLGTPVSVDLTPWGNGALRATVHEVKVAPRAEYSMVPEGQQTVGADVEMCVTEANADGRDNTVQSDERWSLSDGKNGRYEPASSSMSDDNTLTPAYPYRAQPVAVGECVRGWIPFVTAAGADLSAVRYAVGGTSSTVRWAVSS